MEWKENPLQALGPVRFLVLSDLDGTLMKSNEIGLDPGTFEMIRAVRRAGGLFCIASGRSYVSLEEVFGPVLPEMLFLAENGARAYWQGELLYSVPMPREQCRRLVAEITARPDCEARINTLTGSYYIPKKDDLIHTMRPRGVINFQPVHTFDEIEGEITKISAFCADGVAAPAKEFLPRWKSLGAAITGAQWLDFTCGGKDYGLRKACELTGVAVENTAAFGDNYNDAPMLEVAGHPYLMAGADAALRARFPQQCTSVVKTVTRLYLE